MLNHMIAWKDWIMRSGNTKAAIGQIMRSALARFERMVPESAGKRLAPVRVRVTTKTRR